MKSSIRLTIGLISAFLVLGQIGSLHAKTVANQQAAGLSMEIYQAPPCDPVNDPSSCRSS